MDIVTYALARKYVQQTANSLGAVKGAPATIQSIAEADNEIVVIFSWTGMDGTSQTSTMTIPKGKSIEYDWQDTKLGIRIEGETDYEYVDLKGDSPSAKVEKVDKTTTITITDANGTTTADVLDGSVYPTSETKPVTTTTDKVGNIVFNSFPQPDGYVGWVYTPVGWFGFGKIESTDETFILSDGTQLILSDGNALYLRKE